MTPQTTDQQTMEVPQTSLMSIDQMTAVENLMQLGFAVREADFLYLVGTNTGVFTTQQFRLAIGVASRGAAQQRFIAKLDALRFLTRIKVTERDQVLHLSHKAFYRAILTEDSRLRRGMSPGLLRQRLQYMDYIACNSQSRYLTTETDKHDILTKHFGIAEELLPSQIYRSKADPNQATVRFFPERFPIFVAEQHGHPSIGVVYGEDPANGFRAFRRFLQAHEELFAAFPAFRFVYVSTSVARAKLAATLLRGRFGATHSVQSDDLRRYFALRHKLDLGQQSDFTDADYTFWTRAHKSFNTPEYQVLYAEFTGQLSLPSVSLVAPRQTFEFIHFVPTTDLREGMDM